MDAVTYSASKEEVITETLSRYPYQNKKRKYALFLVVTRSMYGSVSAMCPTVGYNIDNHRISYSFANSAPNKCPPSLTDADFTR